MSDSSDAAVRMPGQGGEQWQMGTGQSPVPLQQRLGTDHLLPIASSLAVSSTAWGQEQEGQKDKGAEVSLGYQVTGYLSSA